MAKNEFIQALLLFLLVGGGFIIATLTCFVIYIITLAWKKISNKYEED